MQVSGRFNRFAEDGLITRAGFARIVDDLGLALTPDMRKEYVNANFRFVDRALTGRISFGQFLACYANFLYSYEISAGMRRRREDEHAAQASATRPLQLGSRSPAWPTV